MRIANILALVACVGIGAAGARLHAQGGPALGLHRPDVAGMDDQAQSRPGGPQRGGWLRRMRAFALVYPASDRALSGPDVQKIAEAFLLFHGNHAWKVTEVSEEPERVLFAVATPDGAVIARFAMDRHTARPERVG